MSQNVTLNEFPVEARVGREKQVFDENNVRQVAGTIAVDPKTKKVLVVSSTKYDDVWVLPKGGWESDETKEQSAERETYEEGGVRGEVKGFIDSFLHYGYNDEIKAKIWFYEFEVKEILDNWPEKEIRKRRWCTFKEAKHLLRFKPVLQKALLASSFAQETDPA
ncbi:hypothetical protein [Parasitella parasitica]|uniref:Nudix hydrolase domain-containing protein n=1 Tax=Parasitella parasitica TaxID=35722 RepID=A0A0B7NL57_9FUNG|nr:hypothetical protein [Parasitella parasitica]